MKKFEHQDQGTRKGACTFYTKKKSGNILIALSAVEVLWSLGPKALVHLHGMALTGRYWPKFELVKKNSDDGVPSSLSRLQ